MIYFIRQQNDSIIKIGYTDNIKHRLAHLQTSNGHKLIVDLLLEGSYERESEIHRKLKNSVSHYEWYFLTPEVIEFINNERENDIREFDEFEETIISNSQLKTVRVRNKLTLLDIGKALGITPQSVREIELREDSGTLTLNVLKRYAEQMGCEFKYKIVEKKSND